MATQLSAYGAYDSQIASEILRRLAEGETMLAITRDIGIDRGVFYAWKKQDPDLEAAFEEARLIGAEMIAQDALRIVDGDDLEDMVPMNLDGVRGLVNRKTQLAAAGGDPVARARLRFEGRMKLLAKWFPREYGDKLLHAGHDGGAIKSETALSVKELAAQLRARASGVVIDGDVKELLTDESERFNGVSVSNERQTDDDQVLPPEQRQGIRPQPAERDTGAVQGARTRGVRNAAGSQVRSEGRLPSGDVRSLGEHGASSTELSGASPPAIGLERAAAGGNRRSRGTGGRGGALKRGASPETGGTPAPQILKNSQTSDLTTCFPPDEDWSPEDYV